MTLRVVLALLVIFICDISYSVGDEEGVFELHSQSSKKFKFTPDKQDKKVPRVVNRPRTFGNLPQYLVRGKPVGNIDTKNAIIYPTLGSLNTSGIEEGDTFECIIEQDIKAYVGSKSPVKAEIVNGPHKGKIFIGNATMDQKTKNVLVWFSTLRDLDQNTKHEVLASIHNPSGELGLVGTHHSHYWRYFFATIMSRAAEGYAQASVERNQNVWGNFQQVPNHKNAGKIAVAEAASSTTDVIDQRMKQIPEYTLKKGPIRARIFITQKPILID